MYVKLSKKFITKNLLPHLSQSHLGRKTKVPLWRIIKAIIYRLKTGCQWRELPVSFFCSNILISWNILYQRATQSNKKPPKGDLEVIKQEENQKSGHNIIRYHPHTNQ